MPKVSVIVPVYNTSKYLNKCLDSILNQTLKDIEVIIINDGSTDMSSNIIETYNDSRIVSINQPNSGISITRNNGIKKATSSYIMFIDSDDWIERSMIEELYSTVINNNSDLVVCDFYEYYEDTKLKKEIKVENFATTTLNNNPGLLFNINSSPWNKIYCRQLLIDNAIEFPINLKYEDAYFVLKCLNAANNISKVNKPLINYLIRGGSETTVVDKRIFEIFQILELIKDIFKENDNKELSRYLEYFVINRLSVYNISQIKQKDKRLGMKFIDDSFNYLDTNYSGWRNNVHYLKSNSKAKQLIKSHKMLTKMIVKLGIGA
ncbi:MAG: glycosyltransferase [Erysipelotrichaceae bacterium]